LKGGRCEAKAADAKALYCDAHPGIAGAGSSRGAPAAVAPTTAPAAAASPATSPDAQGA
jgi:hypothetical protein